MTAQNYIEHLNMLLHPEGGHYAEVYRSHSLFSFPGFEGDRNLCTSIFFLLQKGETSLLHRIKSDEIWYYHDGGGMEITELAGDGQETITRLGKNLAQGELLQHVVRANTWFGARLPEGAAFCLVGCQVSPGFDFRDFELK